MSDNYELIIAAEKQFAREVTLGVIVQQPLSVWHYLIPGMFIIDFLRRTSAISRYTKHFIFPRQLALDAARQLLQGYEKAGVNSRLAAETGAWLNSLHLHSPQLARAQQHAVDLLIAHYTKLLSAGGPSHPELIENAYGMIFIGYPLGDSSGDTVHAYSSACARFKPAAVSIIAAQDLACGR